MRKHGSGKTEKIIDIIIDGVKVGKSYIYAIPNRHTIDNFVERLEKRNFHQYIITPTLEKVEGKEREKNVKLFQSAGAFTRLSEYLNKEIKRLNNKDDLSECEKKDLEIMQHYLDVNAQLDAYKGLIITTHHRVSFFKDTF